MFLLGLSRTIVHAFIVLAIAITHEDVRPLNLISLKLQMPAQPKKKKKEFTLTKKRRATWLTRKKLWPLTLYVWKKHSLVNFTIRMEKRRYPASEIGKTVYFYTKMIRKTIDVYIGHIYLVCFVKVKILETNTQLIVSRCSFSSPR